MRFERMSLDMLRTNIDQMEDRVHEAAIGEAYRRRAPKVGLNEAYMTAKAVYARRTGDAKEAERLEQTWTGIEERIDQESQASWEVIRQSGPAGKAVADFVKLLGGFRFK